MEEVKAFTIKRSKWARGRRLSPGASFRIPNTLLGSDGMQCCLGIYLTACGIADDHLRDVGYPSNIVRNGVMLPGWLTVGELLEARSSDATARLMNINDASDYSKSYREPDIAAEFAEQGITVTFED